MPKRDRKPKKSRRLFVAIDVLTMTATASFTKEDIAGYLGVHRNTIVFKEGRLVIKHYLVFDLTVIIKNENMVRNTDNLKKSNEE